MPAKNTIKHYQANSYYHIYNRGVEKRTIFQDQQDYAVFLNYLKEFLSPLSKNKPQRDICVKEKTYKINDYQCRNHSQNITLLAYCLMPNHFHLLVKQKQSRHSRIYEIIRYPLYHVFQ
jgi:REP element-mobilizing transposase RayT